MNDPLHILYITGLRNLNSKQPSLRSNAAKALNTKKSAHNDNNTAHPGEVVGIVEPPAEPSRLLIAYRFFVITNQFSK